MGLFNDFQTSTSARRETVGVKTDAKIRKEVMYVPVHKASSLVRTDTNAKVLQILSII